MRIRYPNELKMQVLSEYKQGEMGYKLLAKKYGLKRDTVRDWVLANRANEFKKATDMKLENCDEANETKNEE